MDHLERMEHQLGNGWFFILSAPFFYLAAVVPCVEKYGLLGWIAALMPAVLSLAAGILGLVAQRCVRSHRRRQQEIIDEIVAKSQRREAEAHPPTMRGR